MIRITWYTLFRMLSVHTQNHNLFVIRHDQKQRMWGVCVLLGVGMYLFLTQMEQMYLFLAFPLNNMIQQLANVDMHTWLSLAHLAAGSRARYRFGDEPAGCDWDPSSAHRGSCGRRGLTGGSGDHSWADVCHQRVRDIRFVMSRALAGV